MKLNIIYITVFIVLNLGCSEDEDINSTKTESAKEILPLRVGNIWVLEYTYYDTSGNVRGKRNDTIIIDRDTLIQDEVWYWGFGLVKNNEDGLYTHHPFGESSWLTFKYPSTPNTFFQELGAPKVVVSINDTVKTDLGAFNCYHYKFGTDMHYTDWYLSPGTGIIKTEQYTALRSDYIIKLYSAELKKYHLN